MALGAGYLQSFPVRPFRLAATAVWHVTVVAAIAGIVAGQTLSLVTFPERSSSPAVRHDAVRALELDEPAPLGLPQNVTPPTGLSAPSRPANIRPIESLLRADGSLNLTTGFHGNLDPQGWKMLTGPDGGPRFVRSSLAIGAAAIGATVSSDALAAPADDSWDGRFSMLGLDGAVRAIAVSGGDVYVGGDFATAGGVPVSHLAKWNGSAWSAVGTGVNGTVLAIAVSGSDVYVGGDFNTAGGTSANRIAKWNGTTWTALGGGLDWWVWSIAVSGSDVYVGGAFTTAIQADGLTPLTVNHVAKWNGTTWSALGGGVNWWVYAIAATATEVHVGGGFTTATQSDGTTTVGVQHIAKWNGSWSALGSGLNGDVYAVAVNGSDLYVGGWFTVAGSVSASHVAKWNGTWSSLSSGTNHIVSALALDGSDLYVGGSFTVAGGMPAPFAARWNGTWSALGSGLDNRVNAVAVGGTGVHFGGEFLSAGGASTNYLARWTGTTWSGIGTQTGIAAQFGSAGVDGDVEAIAVSGSDVYVGGGFTTVGAKPASHIAKWNGTSWSALGGGVSDWVRAIAASGSDLYVGGDFLSAIQPDGGNLTASYIAKWNGTAWSALGGGLDDSVHAIALSGNSAYVAGTFSTAIQSNGSTKSVSRIARWDGSAWSALGTGLNGTALALATSGNELYAGGDFTTAGGLPVRHVARWNGSTWTALGGGVDDSIRAIAVNGADVYVAGDFLSAAQANGSSVSVSHIAKWNGSTWSALGGGVLGIVQALAVSGSNVYAGGTFTATGSGAARHVAKWDGSAWSALGSGPDGSVRAIAASGTRVYVGGSFSTAGAKGSAHVGLWSPPADLVLALSAWPDPVLATSLITYTVLITNAGPSTATGVVLADRLPSGATFRSAVASQGSCSGTGPITCTVGTVNPGATAQVAVAVVATQTGTLTSSVAVAEAEPDANTTDNTATVTVLVKPSANLAIAASSSPNPILAGDPLTHTLAITNHGPEVATGVVLTETLPAGVNFNSAIASQGSCGTPVPGTAAITCTISTLSVGATAQVTLTATPGTAIGPTTATASVTGGDPGDPDPENNTATIAAQVEPAADLAIATSAPSDPVLAGDRLTYQLAVTNRGPSAATAVILSDTLPSGVTFGSAIPSQGSCAGTGTIVCDLGIVNVGETSQVTLSITPSTATGTITNTAMVSSPALDRNPANNTVGVSTTVKPVADLTIVRSASPGPVMVTDRVTYTLAVTNSGPSAATGVVLTDVVPTGVTFSSALASQGSCGVPDAGTGVITCTVGLMNVGATAEVTLVVTANTVGTITNSAGVAGVEPDPNAGNNLSGVMTIVNPPPTAAPTATATPTATPTGTPTATPTVTGAAGSSTPTPTVTPTNSSASTATPAPTATATRTAAPADSATPASTSTATSGSTAMPTATSTPSVTPTPAATPRAGATRGSPPVLIGIQPNHGWSASSTAIRILGVGFRTGARAALERSGASVGVAYVGLSSDTTVLAEVPAGLPAGAYDVVVTNVDGTVGRLSGGFRVTGSEPAAGAVWPAQSQNRVPADVYIVGFNFQAGITAELERAGSRQALVNVVRVSDTHLRAVVPAELTPGVYDLVLRNPGGTGAGGLDRAYTVLSPRDDDLFITADDIWTSPPTIRSNATVQLGVNLHRRGGQSTVQVPVRFYLGNPTAGGTLIGEQTSAPVPPGIQDEPVAFTWAVGPRMGSETLWAVVDPAGTLGEAVRTNNIAGRPVTILPPPESGDLTPPTITRLSINGGASDTTGREILVALGADDPAPSTTVAQMLLVERQLNTASHTWEPVASTGWVTYTAFYRLMLSEGAGTRYIQAYVADGAGNISDSPAQRQISYLPPTDSLLRGQVRLFRRRLEAGEQLSVRVAPTTGDADVYIWGPNDNAVLIRNAAGTAVDEGTITAATAGVYQVEVHAYTDATYRFSMSGGVGAVTGAAASGSSVRATSEKTSLNAVEIPANSEPGVHAALLQAPLGSIARNYKLYLPVTLGTATWRTAW